MAAEDAGALVDVVDHLLAAVVLDFHLLHPVGGLAGLVRGDGMNVERRRRGRRPEEKSKPKIKAA